MSKVKEQPRPDIRPMPTPPSYGFEAEDNDYPTREKMMRAIQNMVFLALSSIFLNIVLVLLFVAYVLGQK